MRTSDEWASRDESRDNEPIEPAPTGPIPVCGDGDLDDGEECDDANADDTDACPSACKLAVCGDGFVGPGEGCDDGNMVDDDDCTNTCAPAWSATNADGTLQGDHWSTCLSWTSSQFGDSGQWGDPDEVDGDWTRWCGGNNCSRLSSLYCVQQ